MLFGIHPFFNILLFHFDINTFSLVIKRVFDRKFNLGSIHTFPLTMRSPTCIFVCVIGLLSSLSMALQPIFSTVKDPFTLRTGRFDQFNVTLKFHKDVNAFVPVLTNKVPVRVPEFKLKNGNLTTSDGSLGAFFGDFSSGSLRPLRFGKVPVGPFVLTADFVVNTFFSPSIGFVPRLISLNGGNLKTPIV